MRMAITSTIAHHRVARGPHFSAFRPSCSMGDATALEPAKGMVVAVALSLALWSVFLTAYFI